MTRNTSLLACLAVALLACSGSDKQPEQPEVPVGTADAGAISTADTPDADPSQPLSTEECKQFIRHVLELGVAEMRATKPANEVPTEEQLESIFKTLVEDDEKMSRCQQQPRWAYECAMKAKTTGEVAGCESKSN